MHIIPQSRGRLGPALTFAGSVSAFLAAACGLDAPVSGNVLSELEGMSVAEAIFEVRVNHTDLVDVHVIFPSDSSGYPLRATSGSRPGMVFVQGGLVATERYFWLAERLARQGFVVALPEFPLELAFFNEGIGMAAKDLLVSPPEGSLLTGMVDSEQIVVGGHSLGGVVAVDLALEGGFAALVLLASYPQAAVEEELPSLGIPSLSLAGREDCDSSLDEVTAGAALLPSPTVLAVVDGVTHYQFTDSQTEDEEAGCLPGISLEGAHDTLEAVMLAFLGDALEPVPGTGATAMETLEGVEVTAR